MSILGLIIVILLFGVVFYAINQIPMDAVIKRMIIIILSVIFFLWILGSVGILPFHGDIRLR